MCLQSELFGALVAQCTKWPITHTTYSFNKFLIPLGESSHDVLKNQLTMLSGPHFFCIFSNALQLMLILHLSYSWAK